MGFPKQVVGSFTNGFSGPKSFRDFRETGPNYLQNKTPRLEYHIRRTYRKCKNKITMFKNLDFFSRVSHSTHVFYRKCKNKITMFKNLDFFSSSIAFDPPIESVKIK